jgi:hypothetical protein
MSDAPQLYLIVTSDEPIEPLVDTDFPFHCPECQEELNITQPDPGDPVRLLGVCGSCGDWYMLVWAAADISR